MRGRSALGIAVALCLGMAPTTAAAASPSTVTSGREWSMVPLPIDWADAYVEGALTTGDGFVAFSGARILRSRDGVSWSMAPGAPAEPDVEIDAMARTDHGLIAVGAWGGTAGVSYGRGAAWTSADGRRWKAATGFRPIENLRDVAQGPRGLVAVGSDPRQDGAPVRLYRSPDGRAWHPIRVPRMVGGFDTSIAASASWYVVYAPEAETGLRSVDGRTWRSVALPHLVDVVAAGPGFVGLAAAEIDPSRNPWDLALSIWASADGSTWDQVHVPSQGLTGPSAIAANGRGVIVLGRDATGHSVELDSPDGLDWSESSAPDLPGSPMPGAMASDGRRVVMLTRESAFALVSPPLDPPFVSPGLIGRRIAPGSPIPGTWSEGAGAPLLDTVYFEGYGAAVTLPDGRIVAFLREPSRSAAGAVHDPATDTWRPISGFRRSLGVEAATIGGDGLVYVYDLGRGLLTYDPGTDRWADLPDSPRRFSVERWAAATAPDGEILLFGADDCCDVASRGVLRYDPRTGTYRFGARFPGHSGAASAVARPHGVIVVADEFRLWAYDPDTDAWTPGPALPMDAQGPWGLRDGRLVIIADCGDAACLHVLDDADGRWLVGPRVPFDVDLVVGDGQDRIAFVGTYDQILGTEDPRMRFLTLGDQPGAAGPRASARP